MTGRSGVDNSYRDFSGIPVADIGRGLDLDIGTTEKLLQLAGHAFDESDEQQALKYCITGFSGMSIDDANEFLESYNYEPLGTKQRL